MGDQYMHTHKHGSVLTNRTKGMQTRLRVAVRVCLCVCACACAVSSGSGKCVCVFCFFEILKRTSCECICFCLLSASYLSSSSFAEFSLSWPVPLPVRFFFFFFEKCSHMLATNARAPADTQPWNWQNDVRCRPLLCHTFRIYIFLFTILPYANIRTHVFQHDLQPAQISTKRNEIGLFAWIWHKIVNAFRYCDNNALGLVTEVRGRAHGNNNACIHHHQRSHSHLPWYHRAGRRLNQNENNLCRNESVHRWCLSSHVCIAHNWYLLNVFF